MSSTFTHEGPATRVVFGVDTLERTDSELERLGAERVFVVGSRGRAAVVERLHALLGARLVGSFTEAVIHTPVDVTERALVAVRGARADCVVAVGGGAAIGLSKALADRTDILQLVVPTTYSGSEMTSVLGETANGQKVTKRSARIAPEVVIYDVALTRSLPVQVSVTSGVNAIAHAVEALYARDQNPLSTLMAGEALDGFASALPGLARDSSNIELRSRALQAAWFSGTCLATVGMALHHKLCHTLGGMFGLPHAETHTAVLPHVARYNERAAPLAMQRVARALAVDDAARGLFAFASDLGATMSLRDLGMREDQIAAAVQGALESPYWNPRPIERDALQDLIRNAWAGTTP